MNTFAEYEDNAMRTWSGLAGGDTADQAALLNAVLGLCGEAGEVADLLKKTKFQGHELNREKVADELGDILWYIALGCKALHVPMEEIARRNVDKLRRRYPDGFSVEKSLHRAE